jgi:hypothetical protein
MAGDRDHATASRRTDAAPPERLEQGWIHGLDLAGWSFDE